MAKTKTSKKQENSSNDIQFVTLRTGVKTKQFDSSKYLRSRKIMLDAIAQCFLDNDEEALLEILRAAVSAKNKSQLSKEAEIPRQTLYDSIKEGADPKVSTVMKTLSVLMKDAI
jgi:probable addiction module antidote protein